MLGQLGMKIKNLEPRVDLQSTILDVVKTWEEDRDEPVTYFQVELPASGLSMGLLYEEALYGSHTESWQLLVGKEPEEF
ncbi:hypothetical protein F5Y12DRAFT_713333 [Xylaria sp. FL1777]|nr:hypothetical protein F5Y12DRAFT_713333 [Xylaria sp. FL1777]